MDNIENKNINNILTNKVKPDLTLYTNEQLIKILEELNVEIKNFEDRNEIINLVMKLWADNPYQENLDCPICLDTITNSNHLVTSCSHYFHSDCLIKYVIKSVKNNFKSIKCPQCRNQIENVDELNTQSIVQPVLETPNNINIFDYSGHQETFFPQTTIFTGGYYNPNHPNNTSNMNTDDLDYEESFSFPINLHTGLWTNLENSVLEGIIPSIFIGMGDPSQSNPSDSDHSNSTSSSNSSTDSNETNV